MPQRRSSTPPHATRAALALAVLASIAACAAPPNLPTIEITSHVDEQRVFGARAITVAGTATDTAEVQVLLDDSVVATVDVSAGAFEADVILGDNRNEVRVQTLDALVSTGIDLVYPWVDATTFRPMDVVIGQADKTSAVSGTSATRLAIPANASALFVDGILYVPDGVNNRVLGFLGLPTEDGAAADFVLGQATFAANARNDDDQDGVADAQPSPRTLNCPSQVASDGVRLFVADDCNRRVLIYETLPTTSFAPADVVVGQATMTETEYRACSLDAPFEFVERVAVGGDRLVIPDHAGHRVLIWNAIPTSNGTEPDVVLGQSASATTCVENDDDQDGVPGTPSARTFDEPFGVWTDGERLLVADSRNARVLLWETFPTTDFAPADIVIGQTSMTANTVGGGATGLDFAYSVASNGNQILVPDFANARVLVFDAFPTENGAAADAVLGQASFANTTRNDDDQDGVQDAGPSARTLAASYGAWIGEGVMIVNDRSNGRYALFVD